MAAAAKGAVPSIEANGVAETKSFPPLLVMAKDLASVAWIWLAM